jgi:hypothetical protein
MLHSGNRYAKLHSGILYPKGRLRLSLCVNAHANVPGFVLASVSSHIGGLLPPRLT